MRAILFGMIFCATTMFASVGVVVSKDGYIEIIRNTRYMLAEKGDEVFENDKISTYKKSRIKIKFSDNTIVTIGANSNFEIKDYVDGLSEPKVKFSFMKGVFKVVTGKIAKIAPEKFNLETKNATIGIRGTTIVGKIGTYEDKISCLYGKIKVTSKDTGDSEIFGAGKITSIVQGKAPTQAREITDEDREEVIELEEERDFFSSVLEFLKSSALHAYDDVSDGSDA